MSSIEDLKALGSSVLSEITAEDLEVVKAPDFSSMSHAELCVYLQRHKQTPKFCLAVVQECGCMLKYVKEQTPEICSAAVQQDIRALKYVKDRELAAKLKEKLKENLL